MFRATAQYYDKIYSWKNYADETARIRDLIARYKQSSGNKLLDMACGTGRHLELLCGDFEVTGADLDEGMLAVARARLPDCSFAVADMSKFDLGRRFDVLTCLFSSIGYLLSVDALRAACRCFAAHLEPGGVAIEPWFTPDAFKPGKPYMLTVDEPELKICRMNISRAEGRFSFLEFHYLIGTPSSTEHAVELHENYLFTREEMTGALASAGFRVHYDEDGLTVPLRAGTKRGLYIAMR